MRGLVAKAPSLAIPWYLGTSWLYYHHDVSLVDDAGFDQLCVEIFHSYEALSHCHKKLVDRDALTAGTGFYLRAEDIPDICRSSFTRLAIEDGHFVWRGKGKRRRLVRPA